MPRAKLDLEDIYAALGAEHSEAAFRWFGGLERAVFTLEEHPARCPVTPEDASLRHLLYGNKPHIYRVIYRIVEEREQVDILHIRHGARQSFRRGDLT
jgi:plasmid stabilization system protein ParE